MDTRVTPIRHAGGRAVAVTGGQRRGPDRVPGHRRHLVHAALHLVGPWTRPSRRRCAGRPRTCLPGFPHRGPGRPGRDGGLDDNWIYIHDTDVQHHAHPELRLLVAVPGQGRPQRASAWSTPSIEGDESWTAADEDLDRARQSASSGRARPGRPLRRRDRLRGAHAEGVPLLRRRLQGQRRVHPGLAGRHTRQRVSPWAATGCTGTTTRTTRCTRPC